MQFELVFIRHGECTGNVIKKIPCAQKDLLQELTEKGRTQAQETKKLLQNESFDNIFSSDMVRAQQTAEIIFGDRYQVILNKNLREAYVSIDDEFVLDYAPLTKEELNHLYLTWFINGERFENQVARMQAFIDMVCSWEYGNKIAIVTHAGCLKALGCVLDNIPLEEAFYLPRVENWGMQKRSVTTDKNSMKASLIA